MLNVVLVAPEIPPNTGNAMRLCANAGACLHLVRPLGFTLETKALRRAGLDYRDSVAVSVHDDLEACVAAVLHERPEARVFAISTRGTRRHDRVAWRAHDVVLFGAESTGLPEAVLRDRRVQDVVRLPMRAGMRSMNLSNAVAVVVFEAWRQLDFAGAAPD